MNEKSTVFLRHIGSTTYKVNIHFKKDGKETMEDKILRMMRSELLESEKDCGIMAIPQMSRQSERSA